MRNTRRTATVALAVAGLLASGIGTATAAPTAPPDKTLQRSEKLRKAVTTEGVMTHLNKFEAIAKANDNNRAAGTSGYEEAAKYVESQMRAAGYSTERQYFDFVFEQVRAAGLAVVSPQQRAVEQNPMSYSPGTPAAGITAALVKPANEQGCDAAAWNGIDAKGKIALVSRGTCSFGEKSKAAGAAGAAAVIIYNNAEGALNGTLGGIDAGHVPTTGVTKAEGQSLLDLMNAGPVTMKFVLDKTVENRKTFNVLAETKGGSADNVVMVGAHLDGVGDGPGINDNASGSAAILEVARQFQQRNIQGKPANKVRFAWWGAEEIGLLGSTHYVNDLKANNPQKLGKIATYLNFDMVGSPNHIIGVYDANESTYKAPVAVPAGSAATESVFTDYFDKIGQPWVDTEFSGRSDYQAFIENGVAAGGLFTGADGSKTAREVELFGGTEGVQYDPNYHTPKDDLTNINKAALGINVKAIAHAVLTLAESTKSLGRG
ncbi:M20/M25/M40 family metallo-hydrolase [Mobilicoccus caccae]|uniref:Amidohydrolase n=1 Tax=Mobilicoccus caccae TaxID=1859295 RepID=A0ABQ6ILW8_9MICO|nr:M20/M25/M40 family metallo-hydrolase [Mobilicoccus caccae]GMA38192.1 amidohydrolase [Mobilicoccus caccae]